MASPNWDHACRTIFGGSAELWKLRNDIKYHENIKLIRLEALFTRFLKKAVDEDSTTHINQCNIIAACRMLDTLNDL